MYRITIGHSDYRNYRVLSDTLGAVTCSSIIGVVGAIGPTIGPYRTIGLSIGLSNYALIGLSRGGPEAYSPSLGFQLAITRPGHAALMVVTVKMAHDIAWYVIDIYSKGRAE